MNNLDEKFRPSYHFTPEKHWMNDPNGMVYYKGTYHLFYQYYPKDIVWGPMHWGHATSKDMVNWERKPIALYPDELGYIFSGSAVVDWNNTSGLGTKENPPLVTIYTYHDPEGEKNDTIDFQYQGIAFSLDNGETWTPYDKNPVLLNPGIKDFRDPKVFWHKETQTWVMSLAVKDHISFYSSKNLIDWKKESDFGNGLGAHGGVWECPDLFPLTDDKGNIKWVLLVSINPGGPQKGSATQYFLGDFDGQTFKEDDDEIRWIDWGADNYAGVTYSDIPEEDGRRLFIGWMSNWLYAQVVPTKNFRSAMTVPRELILNSNSKGFFVQSKPVKELDELVTKTTKISSTYTTDSGSYRITLNDISDSIQITLSNQEGELYEIDLKKGQLTVDRTNSGLSNFHKEFAEMHEAEFTIEQAKNITIYVDNSSVEVFVNDGELAVTNLVFPSSPLNTISINGTYKEGQVSELKNIWHEK